MGCTYCTLISSIIADNIVLISSTIGGLQKQIYQQENYCEQWKLTVHMDKTKAIVFKNGGKLSRHELWFYKGCT